MTAIDIHALAGAYVLNAVDDIERAAFARHLAECEACAVEVGELSETAVRLSDLPWQQPPARLREAVLAEISQTRQVGPAVASRGVAVPSQPRRWRMMAAAAAAALVAAAGAGTATWLVQENRVRAEQVRADRIERLMTAPDAQFRTAAVAQGGNVSVVLSQSENRAMVTLSGLADPPSGKTYELWVIHDDVQTAVGLVGKGSGVQLVDGIADADLVGVTLEPAGGSARPSLPMVSSVVLA